MAKQSAMVTSVGDIRRAVKLAKQSGKAVRVRNDIGVAARVKYDRYYNDYTVTELCDYDDTEAQENINCTDASDAVSTLEYMLLD